MTSLTWVFQVWRNVCAPPPHHQANEQTKGIFCASLLLSHELTRISLRPREVWEGLKRFCSDWWTTDLLVALTGGPGSQLGPVLTGTAFCSTGCSWWRGQLRVQLRVVFENMFCRQLLHRESWRGAGFLGVCRSGRELGSLPLTRILRSHGLSPLNLDRLVILFCSFNFVIHANCTHRNPGSPKITKNTATTTVFAESILVCSIWIWN